MGECDKAQFCYEDLRRIWVAYEEVEGRGDGKNINDTATKLGV